MQVANDYRCTNPCGDIEVIRGTREVRFFFEEGYELTPYGMSYIQRWEPAVNNFVWRPLSPDFFDPVKSDVPELIEWGKRYRDN